VKVCSRKYTGQVGKFIQETDHGWIMLEFKDRKTKYKPENLIRVKADGNLWPMVQDAWA